MAQTMRTRARKCLWGFVDIDAHLGGQIPPSPNFWARIGIFKPNAQKLQTLFEEIWHNDATRPSGLHLPIKIENFQKIRWHQLPS